MALSLAAASAAQAEGYLTFENDVTVGALMWGLGVVALLVVAPLAWRHVSKRVARARRKGRPAAQSQPSDQPAPAPTVESLVAFQVCAAGLGFHGRELKRLTSIALELAPRDLSELLTTLSGRAYLMGALRKSAERREHEIAVLKGMRRRLRQPGGNSRRKERRPTRARASMAA